MIGYQIVDGTLDSMQPLVSGGYTVTLYEHLQPQDSIQNVDILPTRHFVPGVYQCTIQVHTQLWLLKSYQNLVVKYLFKKSKNHKNKNNSNNQLKT